MTRITGITLAALAALVCAAGPAHAQISDGIIKIGVLNDQSSLYADLAGQGSVVAAKMAVEDFGAEKKGLDRKSTRLNSSHIQKSRMPSSA